MDNMKCELSLDDMEKINGGTDSEAAAYMQFLMGQYGVTGIADLYKCMTKEEMTYAWNIARHQEGQPYPVCPNPGFNPTL